MGFGFRPETPISPELRTSTSNLLGVPTIILSSIPQLKGFVGVPGKPDGDRGMIPLDLWLQPFITRALTPDRKRDPPRTLKGALLKEPPVRDLTRWRLPSRPRDRSTITSYHHKDLQEVIGFPWVTTKPQYNFSKTPHQEPQLW